MSAVGGEEEASKGEAEDTPRDEASLAREKRSMRPSIPPSTGPSHNYRIAFAIAWLVVQVTLVLTAGRRSDGAFGFRMFGESSSIKVVLSREVDRPDGKRGRVHVDAGAWSARSANGTIHRLSWYDRVPMPFWAFDQEMPASYGAATQLERLQRALDDVASHMPDDAETRRFLLDVTVRRNGREPVTHQLSSRERATEHPPEQQGGP